MSPILRYAALALLAASLACGASALPKVTNQRCEYRENPIGIDELNPRLSWQIESEQRGVRQSAYQIKVARSREALSQDAELLWDSGRVESKQSLHLPYAGQALSAGDRCYWQVRIWDENKQASAWSPVASWEIGLPSPEDWSGASWIRFTADDRDSPLTQRILKTKFMNAERTVSAYPSPLFRRAFEVKPGLLRARAYVCGIGYNELQINGQKSGDAVLDPGQTTYDKRAFYVTHDIAPLLRAGPNALAIRLGSGFHGQNQAFNAKSLDYGPPALIAKIVLDYADGTQESIGSDASWKASTGAILYDNVYGGETYDARLEKRGWDEPGYDDSTWAQAENAPPASPKLQAQMIDPIRRIKTLAPVSKIQGTDGKWIFDLGQNIAGWAKIRLQAPAGTQLTLRFAEILSDDGRSINMITTGAHATGLEQTDIYVCRGDGVETWEPRFTYHGFRYVEVSGLPFEPADDFLEGVLARSDVPNRGAFDSSDPLLNQIYRTSLWTIENNLHSILEDCPHREKCAWLGDTHAVGETAIFNYDMAQFWTKFADDIETTLGRGGVTYSGEKASPGIPTNIAVGRRLCQEARPDWGSAYILQPWYQYQYYGDTAVFKRHYPHLKRWIEYVSSLREDGIVIRGFGDWCPPGGNKNMECPMELSSTAFFYGTLRIMEQFAQLLDKTSDAAAYAQLAAETKTAFNARFLDESTGGYGSQTADALALRFELYPEGKQAAVARSLIRAVAEQHRGHVHAGIHGGRSIYSELSANGAADLAIAALKQPTWPSYAYGLSQGLTTWPEVFDAFPRGDSTAGRSLNHPMQSGFAAWYHESLAGIRVGAPGFRKIILKPQGYQQIAWVKAHHDSLYGRIASEWSSSDGSFSWNVSIPANTTATVYIPCDDPNSVSEGGRPIGTIPEIAFIAFEDQRAIYAIASGNYHFTSKIASPPTHP